MVQFKHLQHNMRTDNASAWIKKGKQRVTEAALPPTTAVLIKGCSENMQQMYRRTPMPKCDFNKVAKQLYWNHTSAWVLSCKFAAYFQNTLSEEHLWKATSRVKVNLFQTELSHVSES